MKILKNLITLFALLLISPILADPTDALEVPPVQPTSVPAVPSQGGGGGGSVAEPTPVPPAPPAEPPSPVLPERFPFSSIDELIVFAEQSVTRGYIQIGGEGILYERDTKSSSEVRGNGFADVVLKLSLQKLTFRVLNPNAEFYLYISLYGDSPYSLFNGFRSFKLEERDGKWVVPEEVRNIAVFLNSEVPIRIPGISRLEFREYNENGQTVFYHSVSSFQGAGEARDTVLVPAYFAQDKKGVVVLYDGGGRGHAYALETGKRKETPDSGGEGFLAWNPSVVRFQDQALITVHWTDNRRPILHLTYTREMEDVRIRVSGTWNGVTETPNGIGYRARFPNGIEEEGFTDEIGNVNAFLNGISQFEPAEYYIWFTFPTYGSESDRQFGRPYNGYGEKG